jgi:5-methylthioribose kinase
MPEALDIEAPAALVAYLRDTGRIAPDETPVVHNLAGGVSNKTVLVERPTGESWVLKQALPKLRVKVDWFSDPARIRREALALQWLPKLAPEGSITPLVFEDPDHFLLAMEAVPQPHENWKTMLLSGRIEKRHAEAFGTLLGTIHRRSAELDEAGEGIAATFADKSFFQSLRVEPYYEYSAAAVPASRRFYEYLVATVGGEDGFALVHGDYSPKNVLVRDDRLVLLDHEVIHWGQPAFDAGFALCHLLSKVHHCRRTAR